MAASITGEVVESFLQCRYKAALKLAGEVGHSPPFESFERQRRAGAVARFRETLGTNALRDVSLNRSVLARGPNAVAGASLDGPGVLVKFDALRRTDGSSGLGDFHYEPVLVLAREKVAAEDKVLLAVQGLLLEEIQSHRPATGHIVHGREGRQSRVALPLVRAESVLAEVRRLESAPPKMVLNEHCQVCEFQARCLARAQAEDDISLLRGLSEKEIRNYNRRGIFTLTQLSRDFRPRRGKGRRVRPRRYPALQAMAVRDKKVLVLGSPQVPTAPVRIYLDLEGDPDRDFVYLLGMIVEGSGPPEQHSFWVDSKGQEGWLLEQFSRVIAEHEDYVVFHYGSYETAFLRRMAKRHGDLCRALLTRCFNVLAVVYHNVYFPTLSNGLKEVGQFLGYSWSSPDASGLQSLVWRRSWEESGDDEVKERLLAYNRDDCIALKRVTEFLRESLSREPNAPAAPGGPDVASVEDLSAAARKVDWNRRSPFFPDFEFINSCAYFDYQRDRVFARTNKTLERIRKKAKPHRRRAYRINRTIEIRIRHCPVCHRMLRKLRDQMREKLLLDLRVTSGGITRRVVRYSAAVFLCRRCKKKLRPETFVRLAKHGHALQSWALYQHVAHRTSINRLCEMFAELFGLRVHSRDVLGFKELAAGYYEPAYKAVLARLLSGPLVHADETEVKLKDGIKGYVWVLAGMEDVVYFYRPNREGGFLKELFKDFKGVLVTDFYGAYESLECPKQKCLVHLMRDLNNDLLKNPFDEPLKSLVSRFAAVLKAIVTTIDQRGLKRRWLAKHRKQVAAFFSSLDSESCSSDVAEGYRSRFLRHRGTLFTFLEHDGVPWNNSNAEHAIRRFALYREVTVSLLNEAGLTQYLLLLSILQTCRSRGIGFLPFLLSGETDVGAYAARPRGRKQEDVPPTYPDWFVKGWKKTRTGAKTTATDSSRGDGDADQKGD
jgi:predicted RecB family nuclease